MSANIVDVDAFTSPVVVPTDGDALTAASLIQSVQPLSDRTRNNKNRIDALAAMNQWARYQLSGTGKAPGQEFSVALADGGTGFSVSGGTGVVVPATGVYLITVNMRLVSSSSLDNAHMYVGVHVNGTLVGTGFSTRPGTTPGTDIGSVSFSTLCIVSAGQQVKVLNVDGVGAVTLGVQNAWTANESQLTITRVA